MGANIDYIFHPPIDVGVHSSIREAEVNTPSFREHLTQESEPSHAEPVNQVVQGNAPTAAEPIDGEVEQSEPTAHQQNDSADTASPPEEVEARPESEEDTAPDDNESTPDESAEDVTVDAVGVTAHDEPNVVVAETKSQDQDSTVKSPDLEVTQEDVKDAKKDASSRKEAPPEIEKPTSKTQVQPKKRSGDAQNENNQKEPDAPVQTQTKDVEVKLPTTEEAEPDETKQQEPGANVKTKTTSKSEESELPLRKPSGKSDASPRDEVQAVPAKTSQTVAVPPELEVEQKAETRSSRVSRKPHDSAAVDADKAEPRQSVPTKPQSLPPIETLLNETEASDKADVADEQRSKPSADEQPPKSIRVDNGSTQHIAAGEEKTGTSQNRLSETLAPGRTLERPQSPLTESQQARLVQRVAKAFDIARARGETSVRLKLTPPQLGSLQIELKLDRGTMLARLEVETQAAREALLDNLNTLRNRLAEQNIRVDQFDVDLLDRRPDEQWGQSQQQEQRPSNGREGGPNHQEGRESESKAAEQITTELQLDDGIIDVII